MTCVYKYVLKILNVEFSIFMSISFISIKFINTIPYIWFSLSSYYYCQDIINNCLIKNPNSKRSVSLPLVVTQIKL